MFWPIPGELCCRRSWVVKRSPEEVTLTSEHLDGASAEVGLGKELVIASTYQKWYVNVEK